VVGYQIQVKTGRYPGETILPGHLEVPPDCLFKLPDRVDVKGFRRIKGHADIPALVAALENYEQGTEELCRLRPEEETGTRGH
jgi:hypothetical protein